jgi:hypothetical protein
MSPLQLPPPKGTPDFAAHQSLMKEYQRSARAIAQLALKFY